MNAMTMKAPAAAALIMVAMMAAMMLPSVAPTLWRYYRQLRAMRVPQAGQQTALFAVGYASVWVVIGLALFAFPFSRVASWAAAAVVLCAGALQCSRWKTKQLLRCDKVCVSARAIPGNIMAVWRDGCRLGIDCGLSCAAPVAVLCVAGLMDARMMVVITAAITAERVAPAGARIARLTGAIAIVIGVVLCVQALRVTLSGVA